MYIYIYIKFFGRYFYWVLYKDFSKNRALSLNIGERKTLVKIRFQLFDD